MTRHVHAPDAAAYFLTKLEAREVADELGCRDVEPAGRGQLWVIRHKGRTITNAEVAAGERRRSYVS